MSMQEVSAKDAERQPRGEAATQSALVTEEARTPTKKERLSAYFTIAAAAFGLISDGCERLSSSFCRQYDSDA